MKSGETSQVAYAYFYLNKLATRSDSRPLCGFVACVATALPKLVAGCWSGTASNPRYSHLFT